MKKLFSRFSILITAIFCLSGCFKPDMNGETSDNKKLLYGYWEVVHVVDDDYWYYVDSEGVQSETFTWNFNSDIFPNDGNREYSVVLITETSVVTIATDDPDGVELLGESFPYNRSGDRLYGTFFEGDYSKYFTITRLDETYLVLYQEDNGVYWNEDGSSGHEFLKRTVTLRRITE